MVFVFPSTFLRNVSRTFLQSSRSNKERSVRGGGADDDVDDRDDAEGAIDEDATRYGA